MVLITLSFMTDDINIDTTTNADPKYPIISMIIEVFISTLLLFYDSIITLISGKAKPSLCRRMNTAGGLSAEWSGRLGLCVALRLFRTLDTVRGQRILLRIGR